MRQKLPKLAWYRGGVRYINVSVLFARAARNCHTALGWVERIATGYPAAGHVVNGVRVVMGMPPHGLLPSSMSVNPIDLGDNRTKCAKAGSAIMSAQTKRKSALVGDGMVSAQGQWCVPIRRVTERLRCDV